MYKNLIATIGNPVKEIDKIELMARLRRFRWFMHRFLSIQYQKADIILIFCREIFRT